MEGLDFLGVSFLGASTPDPKVRAAQAALSAAGFDPKGVDGLMGPNTEKAITAFWASKGLSHAAIIDDDLMKALGAPAALPQSTALVTAPTQPVQADVEAQPTDRKKRLFVIAAGIALTLAAAGVLYYAGET